ncbi:hypothetical protein [Lactiplantibacillus paraplantarum]|uniref:hypothetical protein n=1 Tax=Lactiplantibacillus paraplantarum TaxID=60520 RepID=UPI00103CB2C7|nr:hypothetical protein [Lactiplantibacillus paraplantarum]MCU4684059.1 hypothetical protein [Lactiplantibacillus paraplantarum]MDL2062464.1 hypothetical protein [Lactiplantibacillus paraplantarum]UKB41447.1 hypothetical protein L3503_14425 [Lactiplantibacillus paraplantarum]
MSIRLYRALKRLRRPAVFSSKINWPFSIAQNWPLILKLQGLFAALPSELKAASIIIITAQPNSM